MTSITNDYTRKIQFAESWLQKAKEEFEQGSELTASSHVILAIAEMEALKRSLFADPNPLPLPDRNRRYIKFDIRPIIALTLLAIALGIFSYSYNSENNQVTDKNLNYMASSEVSENDVDSSQLSHQPAIEPLIEKLNLLISRNSAPVLDSVSDNQPAAVENPSPVSKPRSRTTGISSVKTGKSPAVITDPVMPSRNDTKVASAVHDVVFDFIPEEMQLETIIAARESLNLEE
jgi:hypothetical protein